MSDWPGYGGTTPRPLTPLLENTYSMLVSGSKEPPGQLVPPAIDGTISVPSGPSIWLTTAGVYMGPIWYQEASSNALARSSGVKSMRSSAVMPWRS